MKKVLNKKFSSSSKLVKKVLSRSEETQQNNDTAAGSMSEAKSSLKHSSISNSNEIKALQQEISNLRISIESLQTETESKETKLADLARDKEKLSLALLKTKRSKTSLSQQLEDERKFYYKEKKEYCREMNQVKKIKKALSGTSFGSEQQTNHNAKETEKIKKQLEQTLHTNYNLSVKYLKIKDAKSDLKITLDNTRMEHKQVVEDLRKKIETLSREITDILDRKFAAPISPSSHKYLQLVKQNSSLVYENLCLQLHIEKLHQKTKIHQTQSAPTQINKQTKKVKIKRKVCDDACNESNMVTEKKNEPKIEPKIVTIFERNKTTLTYTEESEEISSSITAKSGFTQTTSESQVLEPKEVTLIKRKRSRSAPKIIQSVYLRDIINIK